PASNQENPLLQNDSVIAFSIEDSGIGISKNTHGIIFEAFQQAEGSTSRKYGGTGLGLSISKGFAELLGGTITVGSELGKGSVFTLYLPLKYKEEKAAPAKVKESYPVSHARTNLIDTAELIIDDDRHNIVAEDRVLLVIEDDIRFTKILIDKAHDLNLKVVVAISYLEIFDSIIKYNPIAITLDVNMPESNGWKIIKLLKSDINLRHIPVHIISGEDNKVMALKFGAKTFNLKPLSNSSLDELISGIVNFHEHNKKRVLIIEDNEDELQRLTDLVSNDRIEVFGATTAKKALSTLKKEMFDCIILDFVLPDANGLDLLNKINLLKQQQTTIILHSARDFTQDELIQLKRLNHKIITKTPSSHIHLLEEILVLLHIDKKYISESKLKMIDGIRITTDVLDAKKVLVVDDDVRNLFALTAVFERSNIDVVTAESGREALEILNKDKTIDIVLMDIMMPEMDGYETIQIIRKEPKNKSLPIIAVTAKAMIGDRQKCISSGASDYITKPVKTDQLLSLMRVWLIK
ncbi:MAG: Histidine kinase, partial [Mucilaginibacter sp.]|nr:Histidine kinase [Mucilaginibacter sp.]